ncbi:hypothetical protein BX616_011322 [Lobosporangium transversale]|nr:hypothetical protein BX616_011322 [Lobosporangium transversale]
MFTRRAAKPKEPITNKYTIAALPPEIIEYILLHVGKATLSLTVPLVCRQWHAIAIPLLRRSVRITVIQLDHDLTRQDKSKKSKHTTDLTKCSLALKSRLIHFLESTHSLIYEAGLYPNSDVRQLSDEKEKIVWSVLESALSSLSNTTPENIRIRQLVLSVEFDSSIWSRFQPLLTFVGHGLTSIRLDQIPDGTILPIDTIIELCPHLRNLHVASRALSTSNKISRLGETSTNCNKQWELRSISFDHLALPQTALEALVQKCHNLTELRIIRCQPLFPKRIHYDCPGNFLFIRERREQFFTSLALYCPKLTSLHVSVAAEEIYDRFEEVVPISQFPSIEHWGVVTLSMFRTPSLSASTLLDRHRVENRLTSLEIVLSMSNGLLITGLNTGEWIHQLLCESPLLEHLRAPDVNIPLHLLYVTKALCVKPCRSSDYGDGTFIPPVPRQIWACRRLKTLHIKVKESFNYGTKDLEEQVRVLYGYISRVCPDLEDLSIRRSHMLSQYRYHVNMCLLSRLKHLRILQVMDFDYVREQDFDWIKQHYYYDTREQTKLKLEQGLQETKMPLLVQSLLKQWGTLSILNTSFNVAESASLAEQSLGVPIDNNDDTSVADNKHEREEHREMIDGVDMTHLGRLQDVINYFRDRRRARDISLWPELEILCVRLDIDYREQRSDFDSSIKQFKHIMKKLRPEIDIVIITKKKGDAIL